MFTGIIEEVGKIKNIQGGTNYKLTIGASKILEDIHLGDSIAVNGICLTAIKWDNDSFTVDVMRETWLASRRDTACARLGPQPRLRSNLRLSRPKTR